MKRTAIPKKRRGPPRRGRVVDKDYLAWIHALPCTIAGRGAHVCNRVMTAHHVRRFGEQKNDRRTLPLCDAAHLHQYGNQSIERLGKEGFERLYGIDIEATITTLQGRYQQERAAA